MLYDPTQTLGTRQQLSMDAVMLSKSGVVRHFEAEHYLVELSAMAKSARYRLVSPDLIVFVWIRSGQRRWWKELIYRSGCMLPRLYDIHLKRLNALPSSQLPPHQLTLVVLRRISSTAS